MPTTAIKNLAYRALLPMRAPRIPAHPIRSVTGHALCARPALERILRRNHVLGAATWIEVGTENALILSGCDQPQRNPAEGTFFRVASITKMATAMVALNLAGRGLLDLDAPVSEVWEIAAGVPEMEGVTARHLLSHTSGLADPPDLEAMLNAGAEVTRALAGAHLTAPGAAFRYSNLGFGLLGCILEAVCGEPLPRIFEEALFRPLGMNAALEGCRLPPEKIMPISRVMPYAAGKEVRVTPLGRKPLDAPDPLRHWGHTAGSLYTDIGSLRRMLRCVRDGGAPVLTPALAGEMIRAHAEYGALSPTLSYGLGALIIRDAKLSSHRIVGHQGFAYGCVDGAFYEEDTGRMMITLNGGCSEARKGRMGLNNQQMLDWALNREMPLWS